MEVAKDIAWSRQLEEYFAELGERSQCYSWLHKQAEAKYAWLRNWIDLPVITLSTIAGTLSIGNSSIFGSENERQAGMGIGMLSLAVSVLNTVGTYFAWSKRAEAHRLSSIEYAKLFRFLTIELSLPREERMRASDLLKVSRDNYERLAEVSPLIPRKIIEDFKRRFKSYANVSKPSEANGLESIEIYDSKKYQEELVEENETEAETEELRLVERSERSERVIMNVESEIEMKAITNQLSEEDNQSVEGSMV